MNDMKKRIEIFLEGEDNIYEINKKLNKTPYKTVGYKYPIELFSQMLKSEETSYCIS